MALGDGCWSPGIHWDAEHSAAFVGPRAGAWPYGSGCPIGARNGLFTDPLKDQVFIYPPMGTGPLSGAWKSTDLLVSPLPGYVIPAGSSVPISSGFASPSLPVPAFSCGTPGLWDRQALTVDVTIGTGSTVGVTNDDLPAPNSNYLMQYGNQFPVPSPGTTAKLAPASTSTAALAFKVAETAGNFSDDPYGVVPAFTGSWTLSPVHSDWAAVDPWPGSFPNTFTIMAWCKPRTTTPQGQYGMAGVVLSVDGTNNNLISIGQTNASSSWVVSNASDDLGPPPASQNLYSAGSNTMTWGVWQHVCVTVSGTTATVYVNGVSYGSTTITHWTPGRFTVGAISPGGGTNKFDGAIANVMIYSSALTLSQVQQNFNTPTAPTSGYISWWPLNDASSTQRIVRTLTVPRGYAYAGVGGNPTSRFRVADLSGSLNASVLNNWWLAFQSTFYTPSQATAV